MEWKLETSDECLIICRVDHELLLYKLYPHMHDQECHPVQAFGRATNINTIRHAYASSIGLYLTVHLNYTCIYMIMAYIKIDFILIRRHMHQPMYRVHWEILRYKVFKDPSFFNI